MAGDEGPEAFPEDPGSESLGVSSGRFRSELVLMSDKLIFMPFEGIPEGGS